MRDIFDSKVMAFQAAIELWAGEEAGELARWLGQVNYEEMLKGDEEIDAFACLFSKALVAAQRAADDNVYKPCADLFVAFTSRYCAHPVLKEAIVNFFRMTNGFTLIFFQGEGEPGINAVLADRSDLYETHLEATGDLVKSPAFPDWLANSENRNFLIEHVEGFCYDLINFIINKRSRCFFALLDLILLLHSILDLPDRVFQPLLPALRRARESYTLTRPGAAERIVNMADRYASVTTTSSPLIRELKQLFSAPSRQAEQPGEELSSETVFEYAFQQILADAHISDEEQDVIRALKSFIRINPQKYQELFSASVTSARARNAAADGDEFSPDELLYDLGLKAFEDGVLTPEEKNILNKVCDALMIDHGTGRDILKRAQRDARQQAQQKTVSKGGTTGKTTGFSLPEDTDDFIVKAFTRLDKTLQLEQKAHLLLEAGSGYQASPAFSLIRAAFTEPGSILAEARSNGHVVTGCDNGKTTAENLRIMDFIYMPEQYPRPVIAVFTGEDNIHPLRVQFKGGTIDVYSNGDILSELEKDADQRNSKVGLFIKNACLFREINLHCITIYDGLQQFEKGLSKTAGRYDVLLVHYPTLSPFMVIGGEGFIDLTGLRWRALELTLEGQAELAIQNLLHVNRQFPAMHGVYMQMANTHQRLASNNQSPAENLAMAIECYAKEIQLNPASVEARNNLSMIRKSQRDLDGALSLLFEAFDINRANIGVLCNLTTTACMKAAMENEPREVMIEYITEFLCEAYHLDPENPFVLQLLGPVSESCGMNFKELFKSLPASTQYQ